MGLWDIAKGAVHALNEASKAGVVARTGSREQKADLLGLSGSDRQQYVERGFITPDGSTMAFTPDRPAGPVMVDPVSGMSVPMNVRDVPQAFVDNTVAIVTKRMLKSLGDDEAARKGKPWI